MLKKEREREYDIPQLDSWCSTVRFLQAEESVMECYSF